MAAGRADWAVALCAVVLVVVSPIAAWWLIGPFPLPADVSTGLRLPPSEYDYTYQAPSLSPSVQALAGRVATAATIAAVGSSLALVVVARAAWRWLLVVIAVIVSGVLVGLSERALTAPTIGANIGAGFAMFFYVPISAVLVGWSLWLGARLLRSVSTGDGKIPNPPRPTGSASFSASEHL
jgi:hypothetical protein